MRYVSTHHWRGKFRLCAKYNGEKKPTTLRSYLQPRSSENYYGELKDISVPTLTTQHSNKVSQFHKTLKNATGKKLLKLQVNFSHYNTYIFCK